MRTKSEYVVFWKFSDSTTSVPWLILGRKSTNNIKINLNSLLKFPQSLKLKRYRFLLRSNLELFKLILMLLVLLRPKMSQGTEVVLSLNFQKTTSSWVVKVPITLKSIWTVQDYFSVRIGIFSTLGFGETLEVYIWRKIS
jgi:hypothetical protein